MLVEIAMFSYTRSDYGVTDPTNKAKSKICGVLVRTEIKGRIQCRELPLGAGSGEGCQWQVLPSPVQCDETTT